MEVLFETAKAPIYFFVTRFWSGGISFITRWGQTFLGLFLYIFYTLAIALSFLWLFDIVFLNSELTINFVKWFQNFFISIPEAPTVKHNIQLCGQGDTGRQV